MNKFKDFSKEIAEAEAELHKLKQQDNSASTKIDIKKAFAKAEELVEKEKTAEAKKACKNIKSIPSFEIFMSWMFAIRNAMEDDVNKKLWNISPRIAMTRILGNASVAEFLEHHLSEKMLSRIKKN